MSSRDIYLILLNSICIIEIAGDTYMNLQTVLFIRITKTIQVPKLFNNVFGFRTRALHNNYLDSSVSLTRLKIIIHNKIWFPSTGKAENPRLWVFHLFKKTGENGNYSFITMADVYVFLSLRHQIRHIFPGHLKPKMLKKSI